MIRLDHVSKTFQSGKRSVEAVRDVSLGIAAGEIYGIIGFSGAGKSTLVRLINLLERPESGRVFVDGTELTALSSRELRIKRQSIGMIFQHFNLMPSRTVSGNVAYALRHRRLTKAQIDEKVNRLLEIVELSDKGAAYPSQLSGGQKQRVAIARALANDPKVLLCDEATSALDPQTTISILNLLKQVNRALGITIVIITHEMAVVKQICHRVAIMDHSQVVEQGEVFDLFSSPSQPITASFIDTASPLGRVRELVESNSPVAAIRPGELLVKLKYGRQSTGEALISAVSRLYRVDVNIIFGNVEIIQDQPLGALVAKLRGEGTDVDRALAYLKEHQVDVEVIRR